MCTTAHALWACCVLVALAIGCGSSSGARPGVDTSAFDASTHADAALAGDAGSATGDDAGSRAANSQPFVMFVVGSSIAMERRALCTCKTTACSECLPNCNAGEKSAWIEQLEALTGTFGAGHCTARARTAKNGATYDVGSSVDFHAPSATAQRNDGVLDAFAKVARLGLATFDGVGTLVGISPLVSEVAFDRVMSRDLPGMWSYGGPRVGEALRRRGDGTYVGRLVFPTSPDTYAIDTGIRSELALDGPLRVSFTRDIQAALRDELLHTRTFGSSPLAAALDDLDEYLRSSTEARAFRGKRYVVVLTGDVPDDDFRSYHCECNGYSLDPNYCGDGVDPKKQSCPYPLPADVAKELRCGGDSTCQHGTVDKVYVVGFVTKAARTTLDAVAKAGGSDHARGATNARELRDQLSAVLAEITAH